MNFIKKYNILLKLVALLIAFILWAVVVTADDLERTIEFSNVKVNLIGNSALLSEKDLMVLNNGSYTISLKLRGNFNRLKNIDENDITVRADVSGITESGNVLTSYDISVPNGISIDSRSPEKLNLQVDEVVFRELPVRVEYNGKLADDVEINEAIVEPLVVGVRALSSELKNATYAVVMLDASDLNKDFSKKMNYYLADEEGNELDFTKIVYVDQTVNVDVPVWKIKTVPFTVTATGSAGVKGSNVVVTCNPAEVTLIGKAEDLEGIENIELGKVSAADFLSTGETSFDVTLPENVKFRNEKIETVDVELSLKNTVISQVTIEDFVIENIPDGMKATVETQNIVLNIRGPRDTVIKLTPDDFTVKVDLSTIQLQNGRQVIDVSIFTTKDGFDIYGTYSVVVNIQE